MSKYSTLCLNIDIAPLDMSKYSTVCLNIDIASLDMSKYSTVCLNIDMHHWTCLNIVQCVEI